MQIVATLNQMFGMFDVLSDKNNIYKVEEGNSYTFSNVTVRKENEITSLNTTRETSVIPCTNMEIPPSVAAKPIAESAANMTSLNGQMLGI